MLLTGASGFLGGVIQKTLHGHDIITLGRSGQDINLDISQDIPLLPKVDIIIHAAGKAHTIPHSEEEKTDFFNVNVRGTNNLLAALTSKNLPQAIIFISSVSVYGLIEGTNITETHPLAATDPYGISKIEAERIVSNWAIANGVKCAILRLPLIAGPNPPGNLNAMIRSIQKGYYFNIKGNEAKKSIVLADDVAGIMLAAASTGGVYNLTDASHPHVTELSYLIADQLKKRRPKMLNTRLVHLMARIGNLLGPNAPLTSYKVRKILSTLTFDDSLAKAKLGWNPRPVLEQFKIS